MLVSRRETREARKVAADSDRLTHAVMLVLRRMILRSDGRGGRCRVPGSSRMGVVVMRNAVTEFRPRRCNRESCQNNGAEQRRTH